MSLLISKFALLSFDKSHMHLHVHVRNASQEYSMGIHFPKSLHGQVTKTTFQIVGVALQMILSE